MEYYRDVGITGNNRIVGVPPEGIVSTTNSIFIWHTHRSMDSDFRNVYMEIATRKDYYTRHCDDGKSGGAKRPG